MFIIFQVFFATRAGLKIGEYHSDITQEIFSLVTRLYQSRARSSFGCRPVPDSIARAHRTFAANAVHLFVHSVAFSKK